MIQKDLYYSIKAVSNSSLGYINPEEGGSPQKFKDFLDGKLDDSGAKHFVNGTLLHMAMLEPEKFVIAQVIKPAAALGDIADAMVVQQLELIDENIINTIRAFNWQNNWGDATVLRKFKDADGEKYVEYMSELKNSGKIGMDQITGRIVDSCKTSLILNEMTNFYLNEVDEMDDMECLNEQEVQWTSVIDDIPLEMKSKLDKLIINHVNKTFSLLDIKTTGKPIGQFKTSFEGYNYPRQMRFYTNAALKFLAKRKLKGYKLDKVLIAVVETSGYHTSQLFDVTSYVKVVDSQLAHLLYRIAFHTKECNWVESMESIQNNGIMKLEPCVPTKV